MEGFDWFKTLQSIGIVGSVAGVFVLFRKDKIKEKKLNTLDAQVEQLEKHTAIFEAQLKFRK
jgi:hypothetical protein